MSASSGVYQDSYEDERYCKTCLFEGTVEVFFDPEVRAVWWTCPLCEAEHDDEGGYGYDE